YQRTNRSYNESRKAGDLSRPPISLVIHRQTVGTSRAKAAPRGLILPGSVKQALTLCVRLWGYSSPQRTGIGGLSLSMTISTRWKWLSGDSPERHRNRGAANG